MVKPKIAEKINWHFDLTSDGKQVYCLSCGQLKIDNKTGEVIHPHADRALVEMIDNSFSTENTYA